MTFGAVCLFVDDVPAALDFYRRAFGFETRWYDEAYQYGELQTGETLLAVASHKLGALLLPDGYLKSNLGGQPFGLYVAFFTPDVPAAFGKAVAEGAVPIAEPREMPWGQTVAHVRDAGGTLIELASPIGG